MLKFVSCCEAAGQSDVGYYADEEFEGLEQVTLVHERLGGHKKYPLISNDFASGISLPRVEAFPGVGDAARWVSRETAYALYGIANPNNFEV